MAILCAGDYSDFAAQVGHVGYRIPWLVHDDVCKWLLWYSRDILSDCLGNALLATQ